RGRPTGVKNGDGVAHKKPAVKKRPVKKPRINIDAIVANGEVKKLKAEVERLNDLLQKAYEAYNGAKLHIQSLEKRNAACLTVIGYLEGKIFKESED
ncbi:MAG: hypothetical protein EBR60_09510, partial [Burkholderiaceae bacterium]|nr:hypothetical protein [Burkholderiaceae bacterium]